MNRVLLSLVSIGLLLSMAAASYGDDKVIGDFEGDMGSWKLTWEAADKPALAIALSDVGATSGTGSLAITPFNGWAWAVMYEGVVDTSKYVAIVADVTWVASEWTANAGGWVNFKDMAINSDSPSGWQQIIPTDPANPNWPGSWDPVGWGNNTRTLTWDISKYNSTGATWMQIIFSTNMGSIATPGKFYLDNVRLIEPVKKIVFVSAMHPSTADANVPSDQGFVDLLRAAGYDVDYRAGTVAGTGYWEGELDPNKVAVLDAADLVIIGRDCNSAGVADTDTKRAAWAGVKSPVMLMSSYIAANNRFKWVNSSSQDARKVYYDLKAIDTGNPLFEDVAFDPNDPNNVVQWYDPNAASGFASFINSSDAGSGKVLAVRPDNGNMLIAEWPARQATYAGSGQLPADRRMLFNAGTQEISGQKTNWGVFNLNDVGQRIFINAVVYMMTPQPVVVPVVNASFELPGTAKIKGWNGEGIANTPAVDIPGWASDAGVAVADSGVESDTRYPATDGAWTGFLKGADPSIWQLCDFVIQANDVFVLKVDARSTWNSTTLKIALYCDLGGVRIPVASQDAALTNDMQTFTVEFAANDVLVAIGTKIGIELDNVTTDGNSWCGLDNVRLSLK